MQTKNRPALRAVIARSFSRKGPKRPMALPSTPKKFGIGLATVVVAVVWTADAAGPPTPPAEPGASIPWSQLGAKAGADYKGDGLTVTSTEMGARLHCAFQRIDGDATREGLWLTSTVTNSQQDRLRVMAAAVGRRTFSSSSPFSTLEKAGEIFLAGQTVRFIRPGLIEEYTVSMDGIRQDFVVCERPHGTGEMAVQLAVTGARVEPMGNGARLVLKNSGRKLAYSRLKVIDANDKELPARMQVTGKSEFRNPNSEMGLAVIVDDVDAVYPVRIDPTFSDANWISMGGVPGANGSVSAAVADFSGNLYIGGNFTAAGDVVVNYIAKWDGSNWTPLGSGVSGVVNALAVSGSDLYAGGGFTNAGGIAANYIAKWNGSSWSALGSGMGDSVWALAMSGSDLYAGGNFTTAGGSAANHIAKWDGSGWRVLGSGMNANVNALAVSGGDLYAGGQFWTAGGSAANFIAKWDGSSWTALGSGMDREVRALAVSGGDLYAGGFFATAGGSPATNIAKWDGSSWTALGPGMNSSVNALAVSGSDLYAGGQFSTAGGVRALSIAKWDGSSWTALGPGMNGNVFALAVSGGDLYAGGDFGAAGGNFTTAGGILANHIAKWDGSGWTALGAGMDDDVWALAVSGSDVYAGGNFMTAGGILANHIAKWDGNNWSALGSGIGFSGRFYFPVVGALAVSGSDLYAGGYFFTVGGSPGNYIAKWDGSSWSALGSGMNGTVRALAVSGGDLYAGGQFTTAGGIAANYIAKWNGSSWSALGSGIDGWVYALAVSGSDVYAGGEFTTAGGVPANNIAKWNGSSWTPLGSGMDGVVYALAVSGSNLYAGGDFMTAGGVPANYIAKWNGSGWSALGSGMGGSLFPYGRVVALAVSGSDLYAGGAFTTAGGVAANHIAKWNGSRWSALGSGSDGPVYALAVSGSNLNAGGDFTIAGRKVSGYVAKAIVNPPILAIEPDGSGGYFIRFSGVPGSDYRLQRAPNVKGPWTTSAPEVAPASGLVEFWDLFPPPNQGFYRTVQP